MKHKVAVFVSGTGRHLENFAAQAAASNLNIEIVLALSNKAGVQAIQRAATYNLECMVLDPDRALPDEEFSRQAFQAVQERGAQTLLLAGFLRLLVIPPDWEGRVLNIHTSLLPAFGGKGYYGDRVHRAVLDRGCKISGCTVHYVDNEYDHGRILYQRTCPVHLEDSPSDLAGRVFQEELVAFPEALLLHLKSLEASQQEASRG